VGFYKYRTLILKIRELLRRDGIIRIKHIFREANFYVDFIYSKACYFLRLWFDDRG
jgi:uncharacterized protein (DUF2164 family)